MSEELTEVDEEMVRAYDGELHEIAIEDPDAELEMLAEVELDTLEDRDIEGVSPGTRRVGISRGNREREDPTKHVEVHSVADDDVDLSAFITPDENTAVGLFLQSLEQHGFDEEAAMEGLRNPDVKIDTDSYLDWRDQLTIEDRRDRLLADAEGRRDRSPHVATYLDEGSFRETAQHDAAESAGQTLYESINPNPRRCYRNATVSLNAVKESNHVQYVEGLALPKQAGRASAHSWLEIRGSVVELTWPWHAPLPPEEAIYFGVPVEADEVLETTRRRNMGFNPILMDDDTLAESTVDT